MKTVFKTTILVAFISIIVMYSKTIQTELIDSYNNGLAFLSSHTMSKPKILGF